MTSEKDAETGRITVTLLGTGTSVGIPIIGCRCETCTSEDPRDKRTRCSCLIETAGLSILIDTSADFRAQILNKGVDRIDAVLFTHHHFDHISGIDDLRPFLFSNRQPIPCYAHPDTAASLRSKYDYIFGNGPHPSAPGLTLHEVHGPFEVAGRYDAPGRIQVTPVPVLHGDIEILGFRIGPFAYVTDASAIGEESVDLLAGTRTLVLDALRQVPHPTHFSIDQAIDAAIKIGARETYFVHMTHDVLHARDEAGLPAGFHFGYDGLQLAVNSSATVP